MNEKVNPKAENEFVCVEVGQMLFRCWSDVGQMLSEWHNGHLSQV